MRTNSGLRTVIPAILAVALCACSSENTSTPAESTAAPIAEEVAGAATPAAPVSGPDADELPLVTIAWDGLEAGGEALDHCSLDAINGVTAVGGQFVISGNEPITVEGWIAGPGPVDPGTFSLNFKGPATVKADIRTGVLREDVSAALADEALARTGFKGTFPASTLPPGDYDIQLRVAVQGTEQACSQRYALRIK